MFVMRSASRMDLGNIACAVVIVGLLSVETEAFAAASSLAFLPSPYRYLSHSRPSFSHSYPSSPAAIRRKTTVASAGGENLLTEEGLAVFAFASSHIGMSAMRDR